MAQRALRARPTSPACFTLGPQERNYVFAVAMKYVKDEEAAADVAQEALLLAHRHRASFRGDSRFTTWLYRIAATTALMHLRKKRRSAREVLVAQPAGDDERSRLDEKAAPGPDPEQEVATSEAMGLLQRHLAELGDKYRDVFLMRFYDGYSESEIAERLGLNVATVKTRAYRARLALRDSLRAKLAA